jgi:ribosome-binding ATPase YchF (GTP1/OBG family)
MKAGLIGWPGSGRDTVFSALTGLSPPPAGSLEPRQGEALVPDKRLDFLASLYQPRKHTPARVEFFLPRPPGSPQEVVKASLEKMREAEVILAVLRNFAGLSNPDPAREIAGLETELILSDYLVVQKRLEKLAEEQKRGKKSDPEEVEFLTRGLAELEAGRPLRPDPAFARHPKLKGFAFLSAKPLLAVLNNAHDDGQEADLGGPWPGLVVRGRLEQDLAALPPGEAAEFLAGYGLSEPASSRVIREVYGLMGLLSFFTVGEDECRAWTITAGETALAAAGAIHSDIQKGFIRAEVVAFEDSRAAGNMNEAKKKGHFRLEGKTYVVADGDIVHFRFNG